MPNVYDSDLRTPLMNCAEKGHAEIAQFLVKVGAVLDIKVLVVFGVRMFVGLRYQCNEMARPQTRRLWWHLSLGSLD